MWCLQAATRSPGVDLAVDLVLSTMSTHTSLPSGFDAPPQPAKLVCLVRKDLGMGTGKVAAQAITERASVSGTPENAYARLPPLQVAHGALAAYRAAVRRRDAGDASVPFRSWEEGGEPTVVKIKCEPNGASGTFDAHLCFILENEPGFSKFYKISCTSS